MYVPAAWLAATDNAPPTKNTVGAAPAVNDVTEGDNAIDMVLPLDATEAVAGTVSTTTLPFAAVTVKRPLNAAVPAQVSPAEHVRTFDELGSVTVPAAAPEAITPKSRISF